jgi:hypothetical protein
MESPAALEEWKEDLSSQDTRQVHVLSPARKYPAKKNRPPPIGVGWTLQQQPKDFPG